MPDTENGRRRRGDQPGDVVEDRLDQRIGLPRYALLDIAAEIGAHGIKALPDIETDAVKGVVVQRQHQRRLTALAVVEDGALLTDQLEAVEIGDGLWSAWISTGRAPSQSPSGSCRDACGYGEHGIFDIGQADRPRPRSQVCVQAGQLSERDKRIRE
ncbi:hypothetical protein HJB66_11060 [Rhizobium lentis]|nr:hypothetical protein [Rhizobium lentis]MBX5117720.1 hypothetical protein [Rhizobium lentis]